MRTILFSSIVLLLLITLIGCGSEGQAAEMPVAEEQEIELPADDSVTATAGQSDATAGNPDDTARTETPDQVFAKKPRFSPADAYEEAFEYGRLNVLAYAFGSGLGATYALEETKLTEVLEALGIDAAPWQNAKLIERPYHSATPILSNSDGLSENDFATWRWNTDAADMSMTVEDIAQSIIAELTLATALEGTAKDSDLYTAALLSNAAAKQASFMVYNGKASEGMFADFDASGTINKEAIELKDQFAMLLAFSMLADYAKDNAEYQGDMKAKSALGYANQVFNVLARQADETGDAFLEGLDVADYALATQALGMFIGVTDKPKWQMMAGEIQETIADKLREMMDTTGSVEPGKQSKIMTQSAGVVAFGNAYVISEIDDYKDEGKKMFEQLLRYWDNTESAFKDGDKYELTTQELAMLVDAYNVAVNQLEIKADEDFAVFLRNAVTASGMQQAELEEDDDEVLNDKVPVLGSKVRYDPATQRWTVEDNTFVTGDALAAAAALMRIGTLNGIEAVPYHGFAQGLSISG